ncbi:MAG: hypothetical protein ABSG51_03720 [Terracidiphilus sp.]
MKTGLEMISELSLEAHLELGLEMGSVLLASAAKELLPWKHRSQPPVPRHDCPQPKPG